MQIGDTQSMKRTSFRRTTPRSGGT